MALRQGLPLPRLRLRLTNPTVVSAELARTEPPQFRDLKRLGLSESVLLAVGSTFGDGTAKVCHEIGERGDSRTPWSMRIWRAVSIDPNRTAHDSSKVGLSPSADRADPKGIGLTYSQPDSCWRRRMNVSVKRHAYSRRSHQYVIPPNASAAARKTPVSAHWNGQKRLPG